MESNENATTQNGKVNYSDITINLKKPLEYNGKTYESLSFDFESLEGDDAMNAEDEMIRKGQVIAIVNETFNTRFLLYAAARACKEPIGVDAFKHMYIKDYLAIKGTVRNFFLK